MTQSGDPTANNNPPKRDGNFLHVVIFAGIALVIGFILAFLLLSSTGKKLVPGRHDPHPTSRVVAPGIHPGTKELLSTALAATELPFIFAQQMNQACV
jgi:hypothetical protein